MVSEQVPILWTFPCASPPPEAPPIRSVSVGVYQCAHPFQWPSHSFLLCLSLCSSLPVTFTPFSAVQVPASIEVFITMLIPFSDLQTSASHPFSRCANTNCHFSGVTQHQTPQPIASESSGEHGGSFINATSYHTRSCPLHTWPHTSPPDLCMKARAAFSGHQLPVLSVSETVFHITRWFQ